MFEKLKLKLREMVFGTYSGLWSWPNRSKKFFRTNPLDANVVMAPVQWGMRQMIEAPLIAINEGEQVESEAINVWTKPNQFYSGVQLEMAILMSLWLDGNAYIIKVRNATTRITELWYIPHWLIRPKSTNENQLIEYYKYDYSDQDVRIEDVIHIRYGIDPNNMRVGLSPIKSALREIFTDEEAANFSSAVLGNQGFPGVVISPGSDRPIRPQDVREMKEYFEDNYGGDRRGKPFVVGAPTKVEQLQWDPEKLNLSALRAIPEERITALLGIPAAVVGFGTGLEQTKVGATMSELRKLAYENAIIPTQTLILEALNKSLLPEYETNPNIELDYDLSDVRVLQEDEGKKIERLNTAVTGGWLTVSEAQREAGYEVDETQNIYLRKLTTAEVPATKWSMLITKNRKNETDRPYWEHLQKERQVMAGMFEDKLIDRFDQFAEIVSEEFKELAERRGMASVSAEFKDVSDEVIGEMAVDQALERMPREEVLKYGGQYILVTERTIDTLNQFFGLGVELTDEVEIAMINVARDRTHLIDLNRQSKDAVNRAIKAGREAGEGIFGISERIKDEVGAGPWRNKEIRSKVIARTETSYAQNKATLEAGRAAGADKFRVIDAQIPADRPHADSCGIVCSEIDGQIVPEGDVDRLMNCEHPNGTRNFVPVFGEEYAIT
jgi:HK97 family phage portal protein